VSDQASAKRAQYVAGLKSERDGYLRVGDKKRAAEVDAELARFDVAPKKRTAKKTEATDATAG
jgi:hypothetical protein